MKILIPTLLLLTSSTIAIAQLRDSRAERLVLDNSLGSTIVLRTPVGAITGGTLTIPDPAGATGAFLISTPAGGTQSMSANLVPGTNILYNLGSASLRWKDVFVGPNSMHIGTGSSDEVILGYTSTTAKRLLIDANGDGSNEVAVTENGRIGIGTLLPLSGLDVSGGVAIGAGNAGTNAAPANGLIVQALSAYLVMRQLPVSK